MHLLQHLLLPRHPYLGKLQGKVHWQCDLFGERKRWSYPGELTDKVGVTVNKKLLAQVPKFVLTRPEGERKLLLTKGITERAASGSTLMWELVEDKGWGVGGGNETQRHSIVCDKNPHHFTKGLRRCTTQDNSVLKRQLSLLIIKLKWKYTLHPDSVCLPRLILGPGSVQSFCENIATRWECDELCTE